MNYQKEAQRTVSDEWHPSRAGHYEVLHALVLAQEAGDYAKGIKAALFYGDGELIEYHGDELRCDGIDKDIIHAILGLIDEVGELAEVLDEALNYGPPISRGNLVEELGDLEWYAALLREAIGTTQQEVQRKNIQKLRARYPEKFTQEDALNRDLNTEKEALAR